MKVDKIGPLVRWEKPNGWKDPLVVISTQLQGKIIEYHTSDFSQNYKEALKKAIHVKTPVFEETPKRESKKSKRKSTYNDSDDDYTPKKYKSDASSDEDFSPGSRKNKTSKVILFGSFFIFFHFFFL